MRTLMDCLETEPTLSRFFWMVQAVGLDEQLEGTVLHTIFALDNSAFDRLPAENHKALFEVEQILESTLLNHIVPGILDCVDLIRQGVVTTLGGLYLAIEQDEVLLEGGARIIKPDIQADNGLLHIADRLVTPQKSS